MMEKKEKGHVQVVDKKEVEEKEEEERRIKIRRKMEKIMIHCSLKRQVANNGTSRGLRTPEWRRKEDTNDKYS